MNSFKLFVIFILLLLGSFAQRFQRHSFNGTQNGLVNDNTEMDALSSHGENAVKFVRNGEEAELELENKKLKFKFCSIGCLGETVVACYDSTDSNPLRQGGCSPGQCEFKAGVKVAQTNYLWFTSSEINTKITDPNGICATATMAFPYASSTLTDKFSSCEPLKHDGNVLNAKKWTPPPPSTNQNTTETTQITTAKYSEANTTLWIGIGVGLFLLLIVAICFGYCCFRTQIQKKSLFGNKKGVQQKALITEASKKARTAENEKTADEKEIVVAKPKPTKEATKEEVVKEKQTKPTKKMIPEKKTIVEVKPSKEITQENATKEDAPPQKKVYVEPTHEAPTTEASVVQKSIVLKKYPKPGDPPRVYVPNKVILPAPKSVNAPKSGSLSGKKDSLSGRHEIGMQSLVQSSPECVKRLNFGELNAETKEKLEKFYPPGSVHNFDPREIEILCCARISVMFKIIEALVDDAIKALAERGVTFDEKCNIIEMTPEADKYLRSKSTPEFVRSFAFGSIFRKYIDSQSNIYENFSIPLLFSIVLQRRYSVVNRRKACTWIRRELPIIEKEFSTKERSKFAYPICAIEAACKMNADGFKDVVLLNTLSGDDDDDQTQNSTRASEKLGKN